MKELFTSMLQALSDGQSVVLCSILASSGSTPRGAGAKMAVFADGHTEGTVGEDALDLALAVVEGAVHGADVRRDRRPAL